MSEVLISNRVQGVPRSFIREILKVAQDPEIISFAGGLPNPELFPVEELKKATSSVLDRRGPEALQYAASEGYLPLREWVCTRYRRRFGLEISPDEVLITTGSQQGLDLAGKVLVDEYDTVVMERPGYLGAIQAFSLFSSDIVQVPLEEDGPDLEYLERILGLDRSKVCYVIPNFQNPSGLSYSIEKRKAVAQLCERTKTILLEDDPYGDLRFTGKDLPPVVSFMESRNILLGTFSKIGAPGLRIGWLVADGKIMDHLLAAKQAADLHTSTLTQYLMSEYLSGEDIDRHIARIKEGYGKQRDCMIGCLEDLFPSNVGFTRPEGGMFLWVTLPDGCSSMELFESAVERGVAFVPGESFYVDGGGRNTLRLNFSNNNVDTIEEGMQRLAECLKEYLETRNSQ